MPKPGALPLLALLAGLACGPPPGGAAPVERRPAEAAPELEKTDVTGQVRSRSGKVVVRAEVEVRIDDRDPYTVEADARGRFALQLDGIGPAKLEVSGLAHASKTIEVPLHGGTKQLNVELAPASPFDDLHDPDRPTAPGERVPEFSLPSLSGGPELSAQGLRGSAYVLEFWATWCQPCVAELPALHAAYAELNALEPPAKGAAFSLPQGFEPALEFVSVSFDMDPAIVRAFRQQRWPMPWRHATPNEDQVDGLKHEFWIVGVPMMLLVAADGEILASGPGLHAETVVETARGKGLGREAPVSEPGEP